jgi:hypothetical protein
MCVGWKGKKTLLYAAVPPVHQMGVVVVLLWYAELKSSVGETAELLLW